MGESKFFLIKTLSFVGITSRFKSGEFKGASLFGESSAKSNIEQGNQKIQLIGIHYIYLGVIKELAPIKGAETDEILGVSEFHTKYFLDHPLYLDSERAFYSALGIGIIHLSRKIDCVYLLRSIEY